MAGTLIWFRNDLRTHDQEALSIAAKNGPVLPLYCIDPRRKETNSFGFKKMGPHRARFLKESLEDLRQKLSDLGAPLVIREGNTEKIIRELVESYDLKQVIAHKEVTRDEIQMEERVSSKSPVPVEFVWGSTLYHPEDLPFDMDSIPDVFTSFRKKAEKYGTVRDTQPQIKELRSVPVNDLGEIPDLVSGDEFAEVDERSVLPFKGGETNALERLGQYFWEQDRLKKYKYTRNGMIGADYSSKFSPWLAMGCFSPRKIYEEVKRYESERVSNVSTYWLIFELIWRDYFRFSAFKHGNKIFKKGGIQNKDRDWDTDRELFEAWRMGRTGIPFIDANMRELNKTGYMSNRGRQNVASFLAQNLNLDWRLGAEYFESMLIDYDPCSNYGNWAYNATVGHDPRNRYFNIIGQARKYDKKGDYVRLWLPELGEIPEEYVHEPHTISAEDQKLYEISIGIDYPEPIIDLEKSYEEIKARE